MNTKRVSCARRTFIMMAMTFGVPALADSGSSSTRLLKISHVELRQIEDERRCFEQLETRILPLKCFSLAEAQGRDFAQQLDQICERLSDAWSEPAELYVNLDNISSARLSSRCFQAVRRSVRDIRYKLLSTEPQKALRIGRLEQDLLSMRAHPRATVFGEKRAPELRISH